MSQENSHEIRKKIQNQLCSELQNTPRYKKYIDSSLLKAVCERQNFYFPDTPPHKVPRKFDKSGWYDLYVSEKDQWRVQRYKDKNWCRIRDWSNKSQAYGTVKQIICPILNECHRQEHLEKIASKEWAIVFCGGGGKGAYHIGVWKWLVEKGIADKITGVSGASVGALNSLLFVLGDTEKAHKIWHNIKDEDIADTQWEIPIPLQSSSPIREIIDRNIEDWNKVFNSNKIVYSALTGINEIIPLKAIYQHLNNGVAKAPHSIRPEYFCWSSKSANEIKELVLASAAIPLVKKYRKFEGMWFVDGGLADNAPIKPLIEDGYRNIIVISLSQKKQQFYNAISGLDTYNVNFYYVSPSISLDDMMKANEDLTEKRIAWGYGDADLQLKDLLNHI